MEREYARRMRTIYGVFFGGLTVLVAALLIFAAADLYYDGAASGGPIYSREIVGERLRLILIPMVVWLLAAVYGYTMSVVMPYAKGRTHTPNALVTLRRLKKRIPQGESEEFLKERKKLVRLEWGRVAVWTFVLGFSVASAVVAIVYLADRSHFSSLDLNGEILALVKNVMPWVAASLLLVFAALVYESLSAKREIGIAKNLLVLGKGAPLPSPGLFARAYGKACARTRSNAFLWTVRAVLLVLGVVFLILGVTNGGARDVLIKAINICTECIGLG